MAGPIKVEAIVLRSIRYGEADRILHLYSPQHGRVAAIAKGARKTRSRFGGRLEPFFRLQLILHQGRSELMTVTAVETVAAYRRLRERAAAIDAATRACDAVDRLLAEGEPSAAVFNLLCNELALLDTVNGRSVRPLANQLAFRLKLLVAIGLAPQLDRCAGCGINERLVAFSGRAGGVTCASCEGSGFPFTVAAHDFLTGALATPLANFDPATGQRDLRLAERAIDAIAEHHMHVRLRPAGPDDHAITTGAYDR